MVKLRALALLPFICPTTALASGHGYIGASLAASFGHLSDHSPEITYYGGHLTDSYPLDDTNNVAPVFSVNGGYEFSGEHRKPTIALGLGIYSTVMDYDFEGKVIEKALGDPAFTLYDYTYEISTARIMLESQFTWEFENFLPFIHLGIGYAWTTLDDYSESPSLVPAFDTQTQGNLAYQLGLGIGKVFNYESTHSEMKHERISIGYRFVGLGDTSFGTRGSSYPYELETGTLNTNDIYFSYTHLF